MKWSSFFRRLLPVLLLYAADVGLACTLWRRPMLLLGLYALVTVIALGSWRTRLSRFYFISGFILGPAGEILGVATGVFSYGKSLYGIPLWLPFAWGLAVLCTHRLAEALADCTRSSRSHLAP